MSTASGIVVAGHGVASGQGDHSPYPAGAIALQTPHFAARGLDLSRYWPGTVNVDVAPLLPVWRSPRLTLADVMWTNLIAAETFSFFDCTLTHQGTAYDGLVYRPHPETKPAHHQALTVLELLLPRIKDLAYGARVDVTVPDEQIGFTRP
ncbi:hypothetical protein G9U51_14475 [Calidifontibacter sp. DB0510]|uniref:Uncharacterized protein n=1 Tax=Metallococcus carri TaxID=1656884 RepID=A0A967EBI1_9MICO|nr:hypothetical protein [Metallococcus carri]NHN56974.1 hypothetical protein [Metallococcus carri]NOP37719.1 hypothetical protein [Calidifontibacter sp. DB2511S]